MARSELLAPLQERDFARLWAGQLVSNAGDWVNYVALTALIWNLTGSAWMVAVLRACHAIPFLLLGPFAGVFVDRWNRKVTLIVVDVLRAGLVLLFPLFQDVTALLAITLAFNVVSVFFSPAKNALIPRIVGGDRLLAANSLSSTTQNMAMVIGPALGGALLAFGGMAMAFYVDSATFIFSALAIATMAIPGTLARPYENSREGNAASRAKAELEEGFRFAWTLSPIRSTLILEVGMMLGWGSINVLAVVIAEQVLGGGPAEYGLLLASIGVGSLVGAVVAGMVGRKSGIIRLFPIGFLITGIAVACLGFSNTLLAASAAYFFAGIGRVAVEVAATTAYQRNVPDNLLGRIFAIRHTVTHVAVLCANQVAGVFTDASGLVVLLLVASAIQILCSLLSALFFRLVQKRG